jgi:hypothetical protein
LVSYGRWISHQAPPSLLRRTPGRRVKGESNMALSAKLNEWRDD